MTDISAADDGDCAEDQNRSATAPSAAGAISVNARSEVPGKPSQGEAEDGDKSFWEQLNLREWITVGATLAAGMAAIASALIAYWTYRELDKQREAMVGQLEEMRSSAADTKALISAAGSQAKAVQALAEATRDMQIDGRKTVAPILTSNVPVLKGSFAAN
jgi:hypothetical protein